jgi:DNA helicase-2/ATP-dependent DNA helicase PcrA
VQDEASPTLGNLNLMQRQAVSHGQGPLLILAGAGSGKTRVITRRIAHLLETGLATADGILAVTFTNKAAREMTERVLEVGDRLRARTLQVSTPYSTRGLWIGTFHSMCGKMLRHSVENWAEAPIKRNFVVFDEAEQALIVKRGLKHLGLDEKAYTPRAVLAQISQAKSRGLDVPTMAAQAYRYQQQVVAELYAWYQRELTRQNAVDFDDLLLLTVKMLEGAPEVRDLYQRRFRYILVDEYQDTNHTQYQLIRLLAQGHRNLCVVGDVDQSIYSFRAADFRIILQFQEDYPDAQVIKLEENYRSTANVLNAANHLIAHNTERHDKKLWTSNPDGEPIILHEASDDREEADYILAEIRQTRVNRSYGDFAVLYRTNAQSRVLEELCMRWGIPYRLVGGIRFYERKEIKDLVAYLRLIQNPSDDSAFERVINTPRRGLGKATVERILQAAREQSISAPHLILSEQVPALPARTLLKLREFSTWLLKWHATRNDYEVSSLVRQVAQDSGYEESLRLEGTEEALGRIENLDQLVNLASSFVTNSDEPDLAAFLTHVMLLSDLDQADAAEGDRITLMTLHAAKGLEFPCVFLAGLEEGIFPHQRSLDDPASLEEERRLAYVGITRARERLWLTHARRRMVFGETRASLPSRFLSELPSEGLLRTSAIPANPDASSRRVKASGASEDALWMRDWDAEASKRELALTASKARAERWSVGDRVRHDKFGDGVITRLLGDGERQTLAVSFPGLGQKILDPRFASLYRIES